MPTPDPTPSMCDFMGREVKGFKESGREGEEDFEWIKIQGEGKRKKKRIIIYHKSVYLAFTPLT